MDWRKVWELPLKVDDYGGCYAWGNNDTMALTFDYEGFLTHFNVDVVNAINGVKEWNFGGEWTAQGCDIYWNGDYVFCVRGWGELTSPSCLGLSREEAAQTQDDFIEFILGKLNM